MNHKKIQRKQQAQIRLVNHRETAAVADVVRQFFGNIQPDGLTFYLSADEAFIIDISCSEELLPDLIRRLMRKELTAAEKSLLPEVFELKVRLQNKAGQRTWREQTRPADLRRSLRRLLHIALSEQTGHKFPWGTLSGVRPTQLALELLQKKQLRRDPAAGSNSSFLSEDKAAALRELEEYWKLSQPKAALALETAEAEQKLLNTIDPSNGDYIVYVGLPFCPSRCDYCSFITETAVGQAS